MTDDTPRVVPGGSPTVQRFTMKARARRWTILLASLALVVVVGLVDLWSGPELGLSLFYLAPIVLATWYVGPIAGLALSLVCSAAWLWAELTAGRPYTQIILAYWNAGVRLGFFVIVASLLSALHRALERQRDLARTDSLTGVRNRRSFYEELGAELVRARRAEAPLTVAYFDIDNFKEINDRFGHPAGDALLRTVADTLVETLRASDTIARVGGDEFVICLPATSGETGREICQRVQSALLAGMQRNGWNVTFSVGATTLTQPAVSVEELIRRADQLMFRVKTTGKNRVEHEMWALPYVPGKSQRKPKTGRSS